MDMLMSKFTTYFSPSKNGSNSPIQGEVTAGILNFRYRKGLMYKVQKTEKTGHWPHYSLQCTRMSCDWPLTGESRPTL